MPEPRWTKEEDAKLRQLHRTMPAAKVATELGRSRWSVAWRVQRLGIAGLRGGTWESVAQAAKRLGLSQRAIRTRLRAAGIPFGCIHQDGEARGYFARVLASDVDRAVTAWRPKKQGPHRCSNCGETGHYCVTCPHPRSGERPR